MSLRKSHERTAAFLAAHRRNAQRCTGPKTPKGKARSSLNALKHGQYAHNLLTRMRAAGVREVASVLKFRNRASRLFQGKDARTLAERSANTMALAIWREHKVRRNLSPFRRPSDSLSLGEKAVAPSRLVGTASTPLSALARGEARGVSFSHAPDPHATDLTLLTPEQLEQIKLLFSQSSRKNESEESGR